MIDSVSRVHWQQCSDCRAHTQSKIGMRSEPHDTIIRIATVLGCMMFCRNGTSLQTFVDLLQFGLNCVIVTVLDRRNSLHVVFKILRKCLRLPSSKIR